MFGSSNDLNLGFQLARPRFPPMTTTRHWRDGPKLPSDTPGAVPLHTIRSNQDQPASTGSPHSPVSGEKFDLASNKSAPHRVLSTWTFGSLIGNLSPGQQAGASLLTGSQPGGFVLR
jgi:hypothetical protein